MNIRLNTTTVAGFFALTCGIGAAFLDWGSWHPHYARVSEQYVSSPGSDMPHGGAIGVTCLLLLLYLIATGPLQPPPVWRPVGTVIFTMIAAVIFLLYGYGPGRDWMHFPGPWVTILSILALLITATIELRGTFVRRIPAARGESS